MSPTLFFLLLGLVFLGIELLIMQLSVFWFMFFGLGAFIASASGVLMPELSWTASLAIFLIGSIAVSAALYPVLKKWQNKPGAIAGNDAIGQSVKVVEAISADQAGTVTWSGTDWAAELADGEAAFESGSTAKIRKLEGIRLLVGR
jgi:membrane protein implicated in regulation of membrane protease activity